MAHSAQRQPNDQSIIQAAKHTALGMAAEDLSGLWELHWELRQQFPDVDDARLIELAGDALEALVTNQLIRVTWWDPEDDLETDIARNEATRLLKDRSHWHAPEGDMPVHIRFVTTTSGDRAYYANLAG